MSWELAIGAQPDRHGTVFRVWAPQARHVEVVVQTDDGLQRYALTPEADGYHAAHIRGCGPGTRYAYSLDGADPRPDPASRAQPDGVHYPSQVVDPQHFAWSDSAWRGVAPDALVIYELHVGAATDDGTFEALIPRLAALKALGVTAIELMPVADFPGLHNWGYDGVCLFAPARAYGGAEGLRRLVDAAHAQGLAVLLDVVYNHLGPDGNYLWSYTRDYFTDRHHTPWGDALNFDGPLSRPVRDFFVANALYWAHEYHLDGLRLDATHAIIDESPVHIVAELAATLHASLPAERHFVLIAEHGANDPTVVRPRAEGGWGLDGIWADDFHHEVRVALTGERESYFAPFTGSAAELARTINQGWFYVGQPAADSGLPRGAPADEIPPAGFVYCIQNHDQVGNRALGERLNHLVSPAAYRAASALLLLCPQTPLLWMGQEWAASTPFLYFTDHHPELGRLVTEGRRKEFERFTAFSATDVPDPQDPATFMRSKLRWDEREREPHQSILRLYADLLALRSAHPALRERSRTTSTATALDDAILLRREGPGGETLVLAVALNGSANLTLEPGDWRVLLDSEGQRYSGMGEPVPPIAGELRLTGPRALLLRRV